MNNDYTEIKNFFNQNDLFAKHCQITVTKVDQGFAQAELTLRAEHKNGLQIAHGGIIFTLADLAFAAASNSHGQAAVAINVSISFLKAVRTGRLTAKAREKSNGPKLASYQVEVFDDQGVLCAQMQGLVYKKRDRLLEPVS